MDYQLCSIKMLSCKYLFFYHKIGVCRFLKAPTLMVISTTDAYIANQVNITWFARSPIRYSSEIGLPEFTITGITHDYCDGTYNYAITEHDYKTGSYSVSHFSNRKNTQIYKVVYFR
jgi:hypothetical protein